MTRPLTNTTIALAEGRQLEDLAAMFEAEGAAVVRCPLLSILDNPDAGHVEGWLGDLIAGRFDLLVLMTGEAIRRLAGFAERGGRHGEFVQALAKTPGLCRGPKPVKALRELGVTQARTSAAPTTAGVIETLNADDLAGKRVGVTLYGRDNPELTGYLSSRGATASAVMPYLLAPAEDEARVLSLIDAMTAGRITATVFTSSPQVDRLVEVATKAGRVEETVRGLKATKVCAVGPVVAEALAAVGAPADVCPEQGWVMKNLVKQVSRAMGST